MKKKDLTQGPIFKQILLLAFPIIGVSFIQMAYNMVDMIWIGHLGSGAVASVGTAGFFLNLGFAIASLIYIGAGIRVSHSVGEKNSQNATDYAENAIVNMIVLSVIYMLFIAIFRHQLIGVFNIDNPEINATAVSYLTIASVGICFTSLTFLMMRIFNAHGESNTPFKVASLGLILNLILDPLLIFGWFGFPELGVNGAAIASVISQLLVFAVLFRLLRNKFSIFKNRFVFQMDKSWDILKLGIPIAAQRILFISFSIIIARIVVRWGADAIAVQRIGIQVESVSFMTASGLQGAVVVFMGQNYGAQRYWRITKGYFISLGIVTVLGLVMSLALLIFPELIFRVFLQDDEIVKVGVDYLRILGVSQLFMVLEMTTTGAFQGISKTLTPSIVSVVLTSLRIPMALALSATVLGLNGVWWSISISSILKGITMISLFLFFMYRKREVIRKSYEVSHG